MSESLRAALTVVRDEMQLTLRSVSEERLRALKHLVKNRTLGNVRRSLDNMANSFDRTTVVDLVVEELKRTLDSYYSEMSSDIADWIASDIVMRFRGKAKSKYASYVATVNFSDIVDERRALATHQSRLHHRKHEVVPVLWRAVISNRREQCHRMKAVLQHMFSEPNVSVVTIQEFFGRCVSANIFASGTLWNETTERKLSKSLFGMVNKDQLEVRLAVNNHTIVHVDALQSMPPVPPLRDSNFDAAFTLLVHLLKRHFHFKGGISREYPGHNICCLALDQNYHVVGMDFNQCKIDKNLCSHAEKRLSEALNRALMPTTDDGKPPSLEGFSFISSLEPCHMCANFVSRMGVKHIGYLMRDPMQMDALQVAGQLLKLNIYRPAIPDLAEIIENAFAESGIPQDDITSWLGSPDFLQVLDALCAKFPLLDEGTSDAKSTTGLSGISCAKFFRDFSQMYPGCVLTTNEVEGMIRQLSVRDILLSLDAETDQPAEDEDDDRNECEDSLL